MSFFSVFFWLRFPWTKEEGPVLAGGGPFNFFFGMIGENDDWKTRIRTLLNKSTSFLARGFNRIEKI